MFIKKIYLYNIIPILYFKVILVTLLISIVSSLLLRAKTS